MSNTHGFTLVREQDIPELKVKALLYQHNKTGAELLSLVCDDENKCFGAAFRTPPADSTGVAHILEHAVLCGSRKYSMKDPFAELIKGSVQTFLNAMTYSDKTCYPVASTNLRDFYNLVDVYLDVVFYPRLARETFEQQGWHYELADPADTMIYKGVVFNEMKGAYSSPERRIGDYSHRSLFPDTTYQHSSGGDPKHVPDLTYEGLKAFHEKYYHPSNARLVFYGDDDPTERLRLLDEYLSGFERRDPDSEIALQSRFAEPLRLSYPYAVGADSPQSQKTMVTVNWMIGEAETPDKTLALQVLSRILLGTAAAPLRKALIDSGLGEDLVGSGYHSGLIQHTFSVGLKGVALDNMDRVEGLILETLTSLAVNGLDPETVEAAVNSTEFGLREQNTGGFPRGLALMLGSLNTWLYDGDPLDPLAFEAPLAALKANAAAPGYFEALIQQHILDNMHRTTVTLLPDPNLAGQEVTAEEERLAIARANMSSDAVESVIAETSHLQSRQETPDPPELLATLPSLTLSDLDPKIKTIPVAQETRGDVPVLTHDLFTSDIVYLDLGFNLHGLPAPLLPYLPLFSRALVQIGTETQDYVALTQRIGRTTGGISPQVFLSSIRGKSEAAAWLILRGKSTMRQSSEMLAIIHDILLTVRLDNRERFRQMVREEKARQEASLVSGGLGFVSSRLGAGFSQSEWVSEQTGGVSYVLFLRELVGRLDSDWPGVLAALEEVRRHIITRSGAIANVTLDGENQKIFLPQLEEFLGTLPETSIDPMEWPLHSDLGAEGLTVPSQVNYVGKAANLYALGFAPTGASAVVTRYLNISLLWQQVRVQGGAYGGSSSFDSRSGLFRFLSWRDPNLTRTLRIYDQAGSFLRETPPTSTDLTRSIIGTIGSMDSYQLADAKGFTSLVRYLVGETDEERQKRRDEVLATTPGDFQTFADALDAVRDHGRAVALGSPEAIAKANAECPGLLTPLPLL